MRTLPLTTLTMVVTSGCSGLDPVIGDWNIDLLQTGGDVVEFPAVLSEYTRTQTMSFYEDGGGIWNQTYTFPNGTSDIDPFLLQTSIRERGEWLITNDGIDLELTCGAKKDEMGCRGLMSGGTLVAMELTRIE